MAADGPLQQDAASRGAGARARPGRRRPQARQVRGENEAPQRACAVASAPPNAQFRGVTKGCGWVGGGCVLELEEGKRR